MECVITLTNNVEKFVANRNRSNMERFTCACYWNNTACDRDTCPAKASIPRHFIWIEFNWISISVYVLVSSLYVSVFPRSHIK